MNRRSFFTRLTAFAVALFGARQAKGLRHPDLYHGRNVQHLTGPDYGLRSGTVVQLNGKIYIFCPDGVYCDEGHVTL